MSQEDENIGNVEKTSASKQVDTSDTKTSKLETVLGNNKLIVLAVWFAIIITGCTFVITIIADMVITVDGTKIEFNIDASWAREVSWFLLGSIFGVIITTVLASITGSKPIQPAKFEN